MCQSERRSGTKGKVTPAKHRELSMPKTPHTQCMKVCYTGVAEQGEGRFAIIECVFKNMPTVAFEHTKLQFDCVH